MEDLEFTMIGRSREVLEMIADPGTFAENEAGGRIFSADFGPGAIVGTGRIDSRPVTIIANDAEAFNERFPVVFAGIIGLEEAYKMAEAVYATIKTDKAKKLAEKRPIVLIVDTPGNAPGKVEEIIGMNKATGAYQLALAEARAAGHPIVALVIGRAISGAFLCHGLQADHILALSKEFGTIIHVMPLTSISRITKMDIEHLEELSVSNPVFASGVDFFYKLGGINEIIYSLEDIKGAVRRHIAEVQAAKAENGAAKLGPKGRGELGAERGGRIYRDKAMKKMKDEYDAVIKRYLTA
ncbi:MAG: biotin-independent malonate decarboxylase subunit gamma [bacterium]|nr:biotin-independent malonate decarboxylase subunit gamma [bacterium]